MAMTMHCDIVSAEKQIFSGMVELLVAHAIEGDIGIAPGHAPLLTQLNPGPVRCVMRDGKEEVFYVSGGYLEVSNSNVVTILADAALRAGDVDEAAAEQAIEDARKAIANKDAELEYSRAAAQLAEAVAQLRALRQLRR